MSEDYAREILRRNVAQICQTIGWNGINSTPLDILMHVLEKYVRTLGTQANRYAEQFNRTEPNLHDLGLVFRDLQVQLPELAEYTRSVPPVPTPVNVEKFPKPKESNLNFLKPGSHEVVTRPMHVHEHLPPMYPEKERDTPAVADTIEIRQNGIDVPTTSSTTCQSPEISVTDSPEKKDIFKRPIDPISLPNSKRPRLRVEEEERTREISSVMMTMSGFLSPAREGKLPEARPPTVISEKHNDKHKVNSHHSNLTKGPSVHTSLDKSEKKSKKSKVLNGKVMKNKRKDKSHKGESSKSKESSRSEKYPPGYPIKNKEVHHTLHNHVTMPAPKPLPPVPKTMLPPPTVDNTKPIIKQEPVEPLSSSPIGSNIMPGEEAIPVPRKIPISKSPLVSNTSQPIQKHGVPTLIPDIEIKKEKLDEEEKLASQPDRSKINIFKRISNKSKEDKITPEVVHEKQQNDNLISRLQSHDGLRNHNSDHIKIKTEEPIVNNNTSVAVNLSKQIDLTSNEVISLDDDSSMLAMPNRKKYPEPRPIPVNRSLHLADSKDVAGVCAKPKKEKKHKEKKDKALEKAAKLQKKQQLALERARQGQSNYKMSNAKSPKTSKPKNESKMSHLPPGFPMFGMVPGRGLMHNPGLIPTPGLIPSGDFLAGIANNPALRGLAPPNLLANPFALSAAGPGLIPGTSFLPGSLGPGIIPNPLMPMGNFGHSSRSQSRNIPPMLRRPSLEVIPVDNDDDRNMHKTSLISPVREKDRHDKHKASIIPNILQKHKSKSHKESHKSSILKMPPVLPDITIELNPPKQDLMLREAHEAVRDPSPIKVLPSEPERLLERIVTPTPIAEVSKEKELEKSEKKKDKSHKKEKKDKDGLKIKKKKEKKDKNKDKSEKKKDREEKQEIKERIKKEKKEKKKEKLVTDGLVPKLTLKLGSASPMPPSSPDVFKLNIKPVVKKEEDELDSVKDEPTSRDHSHSPELAQISALVTRPPKQKHTSKHNHVTEQTEPKSPPQSSSSPPRKNRPPSSHSKYKRILFKPISKKSHMEHYDDSDITSIAEEPPPKAAPSDKPTGPLPTPYYLDEHGNKIWVCPACGRPDNGSPMIGCDGCDGWYHWVCVGITEEPGASEDWFCQSCLAKRDAMVLAGVTSGRKRGRKPKTEKVKDCH